jgi:aspartate beta-hydroxylase
VGCAACPATAALVEASIPEAFDLAMAGGGETLFSVLRPGADLRPNSPAP